MHGPNPSKMKKIWESSDMRTNIKLQLEQKIGIIYFGAFALVFGLMALYLKFFT